MATEIGKAIIKLAFDGKEAQKDAEKAFEKLGSAAKTTGKLMAAGIAAASTAVASLATMSVKTYAEYEQLQGGIETLFKDSSDELMAYAEQAYKTAQITAADYMETATSFSASLIQGLGGDTKKAADYANRAIISMSDNANKMGTSMEAIQNAYQGFAKQNYTMLDNLKLGYGGTKGEMERLIYDASRMTDEMAKLGVTVDENSMSFDNIVNAIAVVQEHMGIAGTSAEEAAHTIQGSFNMMKSSIQDLVTGFANPEADLGKLMDNMFDSVLAFGENLIPAIEKALKGITKFLQKALPKVLEVIPNLLKETLPGVIELGVQLFAGILNEIPRLTQTLIDLIGQILNNLIPQLPTLLKSLIDGILGFFVTINKPENQKMILNAMVQLLHALVDAIPLIIESLVQALPEIIASTIAFLLDPETFGMLLDAAVTLFMALVAAVPQILSGLFAAFVNLFVELWNKLKTTFTDFAAKFGDALGNAIKNAINGVINFLEGFLNTPIRAINGLIDVINAVPGIDLGKLSEFHLPRLAQGGVATSATQAIIGESGKEAVIPLERNTENWTGPLARALAQEFERGEISTDRSITINMTNNINNGLDADEIGQRLMTSIRRAV